MEEVRKRLALQRYERLEQEKQRQELAVIQGHDEALSSPTLVDMARGSYARMADRVRNGQVPGSPLVRSGASQQPPRLGLVSSLRRPPWARPLSGPHGRAAVGAAPHRASRHRP